jgi:hypothetical protein
VFSIGLSPAARAPISDSLSAIACAIHESKPLQPLCARPLGERAAKAARSKAISPS